jgi:hypothetical protein
MRAIYEQRMFTFPHPIGIAKSQRVRCLRKKAGTSICLDRSVEDRHVAASTSDQLRAFNSRENC